MLMLFVIQIWLMLILAAMWRRLARVSQAAAVANADQKLRVSSLRAAWESAPTSAVKLAALVLTQALFAVVW